VGNQASRDGGTEAGEKQEAGSDWNAALDGAFGKVNAKRPKGAITVRGGETPCWK